MKNVKYLTKTKCYLIKMNAIYMCYVIYKTFTLFVNVLSYNITFITEVNDYNIINYNNIIQ